MRDANFAVPMARTFEKSVTKMRCARCSRSIALAKSHIRIEIQKLRSWPRNLALASLLQHIGPRRIAKRRMIRSARGGRIDRFVRPRIEPGGPLRPPGTVLLRRLLQEGFRIDVAVVLFPGHHLEAA